MRILYKHRKTFCSLFIDFYAILLNCQNLTTLPSFQRCQKVFPSDELPVYPENFRSGIILFDLVGYDKALKFSNGTNRESSKQVVKNDNCKNF